MLLRAKQILSLVFLEQDKVMLAACKRWERSVKIWLIVSGSCFKSVVFCLVSVVVM